MNKNKIKDLLFFLNKIGQDSKVRTRLRIVVVVRCGQYSGSGIIPSKDIELRLWWARYKNAKPYI